MGLPVLIIGESGSGKTYSIKNFDPAEVGIFEVEKGRLPFKKAFKVAKHATYEQIMATLKAPKLKAYVIDDSQYLLVNELFDRAKETGYGKYTDMALNFRNLIHYVNFAVPDDVVVYFLHHPETDPNTGKVKAKTVGRMIDQYLTLEGCFDIVLFCTAGADGHNFVTQTDGTNTAKVPEGMLPAKMPNDLKAVDTAIRDYYGMEGGGKK